MERAVITGGRCLHLDLPAEDHFGKGDKTSVIPPEADRILTADEMATLERENIIRALRATKGRVYGKGGAAKLLSLRPTTLTSRMKALGIPGSKSSRWS
jgi:transcriptional regulator with GAF, ATPase, and Fis domain